MTFKIVTVCHSESILQLVITGQLASLFLLGHVQRRGTAPIGSNRQFTFFQLGVIGIIWKPLGVCLGVKGIWLDLIISAEPFPCGFISSWSCRGTLKTLKPMTLYPFGLPQSPRWICERTKFNEWWRPYDFPAAFYNCHSKCITLDKHFHHYTEVPRIWNHQRWSTRTTHIGCWQSWPEHTVDGRNPAPPWMVETL